MLGYFAQPYLPLRQLLKVQPPDIGWVVANTLRIKILNRQGFGARRQLDMLEKTANSADVVRQMTAART